jgi:hypothetical protein
MAEFLMASFQTPADQPPKRGSFTWRNRESIDLGVRDDDHSSFGAIPTMKTDFGVK